MITIVLRCDRCKQTTLDSGLMDADMARTMAWYAGWIITPVRHTCPECAHQRPQASSGGPGDTRGTQLPIDGL